MSENKHELILSPAPNSKDKSLIDVITPAEVIALNGMYNLKSLIVKYNGLNKTIETDCFIPLFGLIPKLSIGDWGLEIEKNAIVVDNSTRF